MKSNNNTDPRRIFLTNVPLPIEQEYLEVYLEYLSNETEVESVHLGSEIKNSLLVTYVRPVDFERVIRVNHGKRPTILGNRTGLFEVTLPNIILVETDDEVAGEDRGHHLVREFFNKEFLELYFSNRKRSGGESIRSLLMDFSNGKQRAYILFENSDMNGFLNSMINEFVPLPYAFAQCEGVKSFVDDLSLVVRNIVSRKHQLNKLVLKVKPYYENIGSLAYLTVLFQKSNTNTETASGGNNTSTNNNNSLRAIYTIDNDGRLESENQKQQKQKQNAAYTYTSNNNYNNNSRNNDDAYATAMGGANAYPPFLSSSSTSRKNGTTVTESQSGKNKLNAENAYKVDIYRSEPMVSSDQNTSKSVVVGKKSQLGSFVKDIIFDLTESSSSVNNNVEEKDSIDTLYEEESTKNRESDLLKKPAVNLPRLDNAVLSLEDYNAMRNNNNNTNTTNHNNHNNNNNNNVDYYDRMLLSAGSSAKQASHHVVQRIHTAKDSKPPLPRILKPISTASLRLPKQQTQHQVQANLQQDSVHTTTTQTRASNNRKSVIVMNTLKSQPPPPPKVVAKPPPTTNTINLRQPGQEHMPPLPPLKNNNNNNILLTTRAKSCNLSHCKDDTIFFTTAGGQSSNAEKMRQLRTSSARKQRPNHPDYLLNSNQNNNLINKPPLPVITTPVKLAIVNHYGSNTLAEASSKLNAAQLAYIDSHALIMQLRAAYPKTSVNLNASMRRVYIFGDRGQVLDAKARLASELAHLGNNSEGTMTPPVVIKRDPTRIRAATVVGYDYNTKYMTYDNNNSVAMASGGHLANSTSSSNGNYRNTPLQSRVVNKQTFNTFINSLLVKYN